MPLWTVWSIALVCAAAFIWLWFREVRRVMRECRNALDSAESQLAVWRARQRDGPEAEEILCRSEKIYEQAQKHYRKTLRKPWIFLPAILMGFMEIRMSK